VPNPGFLALLSVFPTLPLLAADPPAPATVPLKFAWPAHLRCEVEQKMSFDHKDGAAPLDTSMRVALDAVRDAGGWRVRQKVLESTPKGKMDLRELEVLLSPPFRIGKDGAFVGLDLTPEDKAILAKRQEAENKKSEMAKKLDPSLASLLNEDLLASATKRTTSAWSFLVGAWAGKELPPGNVPELRTERDQAFPMIGMVHVVDRLKVSPGASCSPAPKGGCVKLEITSSPDLASGVGPAPGPGVPLKDSHFQLTQTLLTDPRTLVPRRVTRVSEVDMAGPDPKTEHKHVMVTDSATYRCK
jgi:hypothetical protein